jgi:hypothetical protein
VYYFDEDSNKRGSKFNFTINEKIMKSSRKLIQRKDATSEELSLMMAKLRETSTRSWRDMTEQLAHADHQPLERNLLNVPQNICKSMENLETINDFIKGFKTDFLDMNKKLEELTKQVQKLNKKPSRSSSESDQ